jgi:hypothetical protein
MADWDFKIRGTAISAIQMQETIKELWRMIFCKENIADGNGDLEVPRGYCWGYTKVYLRHSPKLASQGGP